MSDEYRPPPTPDKHSSYATLEQPAGLYTRCVEAGLLTSLASERLGRATSSPPQFGHLAEKVVAQASQNVHSNEQMRAPDCSAGRSLSQHSQLGLICSMVCSSIDVGVQRYTMRLSKPETLDHALVRFNYDRRIGVDTGHDRVARSVRPSGAVVKLLLASGALHLTWIGPDEQIGVRRM